ncbi:MAG: FGGY family carbohydrate kinase [Anaerolineae bacterium]|nr:FGGY family carbohydrate kinase [Anaerolineae bacterium]
MGDKLLIGVDLGTSATKATMYRVDGAVVAEASAEVPLYYPAPGVVEQENEDFYTSAAQTVRECVVGSGIDPRDVAAIAFDSQMAGVGAVDEEFKPATRFDSWLDMRCKPYIEQLNREAGDRITRLSGCPPTCDHGPKILWWKEEEPESYARTAKYVMPAGYVAGTMAGLKSEDAFIDYTFIHFSALSDARAGTWSQELCDVAGIDMGKLPRSVVPWEIIGEVTDEASKAFGLAPGTPIAAGCGDTAAGALGAGIVRPGMVLDTAGTASVLAGCTDQFVADEENRALLCMRSVVPGLWNPLAYIAGGGLALRWFRDEFSGAGDDTDVSADDVYALLSQRAADVSPGADGLFFSPHLGGRICPAEPAMRGAWVGFSWGHTRDHFFRAVLESVAFEYAYYLRILRDLIPDLSLVEARVIGGGAKSPQWNQIKADVLGVPYQRLRRSEFATWGCALVAGRAVGLFDDLAEAATRTTQPDGAPIQPQQPAVETYRQLSAQYVSWQGNLAEAFHALAAQ